MILLEYANKFNELECLCPHFIELDRSKANHFEHGFKYIIQTCLSSHLSSSYNDVLERALKVESNMKKFEWERGDRKRRRPTRT